MPSLPVPRGGGRGNTPGPGLQTGERIVKCSRKALGRGGRNGVLVRVVGEHSFAWLEAANLWGAALEAVVRGGDLPKTIREEFDFPKAIAPDLALDLDPSGAWSGVMFGTIHDKQDADVAVACFEAWRPSALVCVLPGDLSRSACARLVADRLKAPGYRLHRRRLDHSRLGGGDWVRVVGLSCQTRGGSGPEATNDGVQSTSITADIPG